MKRKCHRGRPTKYKPAYCKDIIAYFDIPPTKLEEITKLLKDGSTLKIPMQIANDLPLFSAYANKIGVCVDTLLEWCKQHDEFSEAYKRAKSYQENILVQNGLRGKYEQPFAIFTAKNILEWRDKTETDLTSKGEKIVWIRPSDYPGKPQ